MEEMTRSSSKPFDELSDSEASGWTVRTAESGDVLTVRRPPDDYESEMYVLEKTETEWTTTLLVRPVVDRAIYSEEDVRESDTNPAEIKTVKGQTATGGTVDRDGPGAWNGPTMGVLNASKVGEHKWVRVEEADDL